MKMNRHDTDRPIIELLPPLPKKCLAIVHLLHIAMIVGPLLIAYGIGETFGWLDGFFAWLAGVFAAMIVISKIKLNSVPLEQHELSHSTTAILKWFVARRFCGF